jgi:hypothetical protein
MSAGCGWIRVGTGGSPNLTPSLLYGISGLVPLVTWALSRRLNLCNWWARRPVAALSDTPSALSSDEEEPLLEGEEQERYAPSLSTKKCLQALTGVVVVQGCLEAWQWSQLLPWLVLRRVPFDLALGVTLILLLRTDYNCSAPLMAWKALKRVHLAMVRFSLAVWCCLALEAYHRTLWILHPADSCPTDPNPPQTRWSLALFFLKLAALVAFSASLIPQSQRVHQLEYESLPTDAKYKPPTSFKEFSMHFSKLIPFIWPKGNDALRLQSCMLFSFIFMVCGRIVNLLVPLQYKRVVDALGGFASGLMSNATSSNMSTTLMELHLSSLPYREILLFVSLRFLSGSSGVLQSLQSFLWIPVGQYTTREISVQMLRHLHK